MKLAEALNNPHDYTIQLPVEDTDDLPPVNSFVYVKWTECDDEPPGWYKAQIDQYFLDGTCKITYDDKDDHVVYEIVDLKKVEWKSCSKKARKFVSLHDSPAIGKSSWKRSPKLQIL